MASRHGRLNVDTSRAVHRIDRTQTDVIVFDSVRRMPIGRFSLAPPSLPASLSGGGGDIERLPD